MFDAFICAKYDQVISTAIRLLQIISKLLDINEKKIIADRSNVNVKKPILPCAMGYIIVEPSPQPTIVLDKCIRGKLMATPSGFYYKDQWMSLTCNIHSFNTPAKVTECLRRKKIHMFGDSTMRQWFEYLIEFVPGIRMFDLGNPIIDGPHCAFDMQNNIMLEYIAHGPPILFGHLSSQHMYYISNKLNEIEGGKDTVITIAICAHFTTFPAEVYIRRLQHIRRSILQLLSRNPDTVVVIKTANVRGPTQNTMFNFSDWFTFQLDLLMRRMFAGIKVAFVDAWAMTIAHYLPHNIHPLQIIIKNEIDVFLSHMCPSNKR
ncbi:NXPE family member 3-like [Amblyraja radiata]|uniref:NXPE family member 3-like n=1 Tax=Amblyraja radiata TaxID=386614 RepID=UPI001402C718|nr:NXPE family member 3-like [Amblyraja radiata]